MNRAPILVMAGGTGGHVFPALAVAGSLREKGWPVVWLGTRHGIEARVVPPQGIEIEWVRIAGLRGKRILSSLAAPFRILYALWAAVRVMHRRRPAAVLGMGGYVAGPGGLAAWLTRTPLLVHEQNAVAGLTNRLLAPLARRVLTGFPDTLTRGEWIGNPVRAGIVALPAPAARMEGRSGPLRLLVLGGSQGARVLNTVVPQAVALLPASRRPQVRHQCGEALIDEACDAWRASGVDVEPEPFIDDIAAAYAWADFVLCRAGALTVAELMAAGLAGILVPYPSAVDDHQTRNAAFLVSAGAAEVIPQRELDATRLAGVLARAERGALLEMANAAHALARPAAATMLADACIEAAGRDGE